METVRAHSMWKFMSLQKLIYIYTFLKKENSIPFSDKLVTFMIMIFEIICAKLQKVIKM